MKKHRLFQFFTVLLCLACFCTSFASCTIPEEVNPANYNLPDDHSLITYTISDTEQIVLLYDSEVLESQYKMYGEWRKGETTTRIAATEITEYWGIFSGRMGVTDYYFSIQEIDGIELYGDTDIYDNFIGSQRGSPRKHPLNPTTIARTNAGPLNSTGIKMYDSDTEIPIISTSVTPSTFDQWEWDDLGPWTEFCSYDENTVFRIDALNLTYIPYKNMGEWKQGNVTIPIKIHFYDDIQAFAVYDLSDNGSKLILVVNVGLNENGSMTFTSAYGNLHNEDIDVKSIVLYKENGNS